MKFFVIDSFMKCGIDESDYDGQKKLMDKLCDFANKHNAHVLVVTHSRKTDSESKPTGKMDVKGTGAITDLADNVFVIWRNKLKERAIQSESAGKAITNEESMYRNLDDALLILDKQREGNGWEGSIGLTYNSDSNQYLSAGEPRPYNYVLNCIHETAHQKKFKNND